MYFNYRILILLFLTIVIPAAPAAGQVQPAQERLDRIIQDLDSFRSEFEQTVFGASGNILEESSGEVTLTRTGRFYWKYRKPYEQYLISDGVSLWVYDKDLQQVTINDIRNNIKNSPVSILGGNIEIDENYNVIDLGLVERTHWIELTPKAEDSEFRSIRLGFRNQELGAMVLMDSLGQVTQIIFTNPVMNIDVDPSLFEFSPPEGVDIIDMREL